MYMDFPPSNTDDGAEAVSIAYVQAALNLGVPSEEKLLLVSLANYASPEGVCWPGVKNMMRHVGVTERSVHRLLRKLEARGLIEVLTKGGRGGRANTYRLTFPPDGVSNTDAGVGDVPENTDTHVMVAQTNTDVDVMVANPDTDAHVMVETPEPCHPRHPTLTPASDQPSINRQVVVNKDISITPPYSPPTETKPTPDPRIDEVWEHYRQKIQPAARLMPREKIRARLKTFSAEDLKAGIDAFAADPWWMEHCASRGGAWFFHSDARSEQFRLLAEKQKPREDDPDEPFVYKPRQRAVNHC